MTASLLDEAVYQRELTPLEAIKNSFPKTILTLDGWRTGITSSRGEDYGNSGMASQQLMPPTPPLPIEACRPRPTLSGSRVCSGVCGGGNHHRGARNTPHDCRLSCRPGRWTGVHACFTAAFCVLMKNESAARIAALELTMWRYVLFSWRDHPDVPEGYQPFSITARASTQLWSG